MLDLTKFKRYNPETKSTIDEPIVKAGAEYVRFAKITFKAFDEPNSTLEKKMIATLRRVEDNKRDLLWAVTAKDESGTIGTLFGYVR